MGYNRAKNKMKKNLFVTAILLIGMIAGAMVFSSFKAPKQEKNTNVKQIEMQGPWKLFREQVTYCDGDTGRGIGKGNVWVNTETYQVQMRIGTSQTKYDLTEYTGKDGFNMRFWHDTAQTYYYINLYIPAQAFY